MQDINESEIRECEEAASFYERRVHQGERRKVWLQAWCATANAYNCTRAEVATGFADECLHEFDKRFPAP